MRDFFVETKKELGFICEGVEFPFFTESTFRERIVLSCLRDWSFFFASRRAEKVEMGFCFVWMFFFLFFVSWVFSFLFRVFIFFLSELSFPSTELLILIEDVFLRELSFLFAGRVGFCELMFFFHERVEFLFIRERVELFFLFFLRELFLFFTERDRELVLSRESLLFSTRRLNLFLE